jgi:hypothetical protein
MGGMMAEQKQKKRGNVANDISDAVLKVTKPWKRQRKAEERQPGNVRYRYSRLTAEPKTKLKHVVWRVMEQCYMAASSNDRLPAKARQIYYQVRPHVMKHCSDKELEYGYFAQQLLPDYIREHGKEHWKVVYDARGHLVEPHTEVSVECGTLEIRNYIRAMRRPKNKDSHFQGLKVETKGPDGNYGAVLYVEKEGFDALFKEVDLANRYDLMIVSNKGMSVTATRELIDTICGSRQRLPLFVLHDFDVAGFSIFATLHRDTKRYQYSSEVQAIDLGLRLEDIDGLETEPAAYTKANEDKLRDQLERNGATEEEIDFLLEDRVELNAMTSDELVEMVERKLQEHGVKKVIPDDHTLAETYRGFHRSERLSEAFEELEKGFETADIDVPEDLRKRVEERLQTHPAERWDAAVEYVLDDEGDDGE